MVLRAQPHILVIDDDEVARESAQILLSRWGNRVSLAEGGETGLHMMRQDPPDLCLVDLQMPGLSGLEVLGKIKDFDPTIVCIIITGYATLQSAVDALKEGAYDFLAKPFSPNELKRAIDRGLERRFLELETAALREEKDRMEANFVTMVSHQLRSPLAAVRQLMEVVASEALGPMDGPYRDIMGRATSRLDDLLQSLNSWLSMSQIQDEGIVERKSRVGISELLGRLVHRLSIDAEAAGQTIKLAGQDDESVVIDVDGESLIEALYNIASNAVKYNKPGGEVTLSWRADDFLAHIGVADQGPGIPEAELPFLFDDFFRSQRPELKNKPGTGLGLSISRKIIKAHDGDIKVNSTMGEGSTFTVILPRARAGK